MSFEEVLANCLHRLEQGRSVEDCLAQYPEHRAELAPILRMIDPMRHGPKPQLSARAFARGRAAVAAYARHQQKLREPFTAATPRAVQSRPFYAQAPITPGVKAAQIKPPVAPLPPRPFLQMHRLMRAFVVLLFFVTFASFVRGVASSLPGSWLYPVKGWGENAQGLLMLASGQQASWHVNQLERRLTEFALLNQQSAPIHPTLTTAIDDHLQAALDASTAMSADQRSQFLLAWLDRLHLLQQDLPEQTTTVATLNHAIATVEGAAQRHNEPTILQVESTATPIPQFTPVATPTVGQVILPTLTPTDTELPAPPVVLDTPTPTLVEIVPTPTETATTPAIFNPATPTPTNTASVIAPTATESPQLMPEEGNRAPEPSDAAGSGSSKKAPPTATALPAAIVTATPIATLPAPRIPLPTDVTTEEAGTPTTAEPTEPANQTRVPGGIPTSAEPPTPAPTDTARNTPTATEKAATSTPTRAENKTSTPEPTATEKAATPTPTRPEATATPKPEETTRETPAPNTDSPTPTEDETAEPAEELDEPTPEPTPTPKKKKK